jgi:hypothetical protein
LYRSRETARTPDLKLVATSHPARLYAGAIGRNPSGLTRL